MAVSADETWKDMICIKIILMFVKKEPFINLICYYFKYMH